MTLPTKEERAAFAAEAATRIGAWLAHAEPGTREVYHEGFLLDDRHFNPAAGATGDALRHAADAGLVFLTQERVADHHYIYWATRARQVKPPRLRRAAR